MLLAIQQANEAGGVGGYTLVDNTQDDAKDGVPNPEQGAANMATLVADEAVVGVVGPFNSGVARFQIPVSNAAGLAQCSPANTGVDLTKEGSEAYRPEKPDQRSYFRVATTDDIQGPAAAALAYNDAGARNIFVVDDTTAFGVGVGGHLQRRVRGARWHHRRSPGQRLHPEPGLHRDVDRAGRQLRLRVLRRHPDPRRRPDPQADGSAGHPGQAAHRSRRHRRPAGRRQQGRVHHARRCRELRPTYGAPPPVSTRSPIRRPSRPPTPRCSDRIRVPTARWRTPARRS